jgi:hypothetical protein
MTSSTGVTAAKPTRPPGPMNVRRQHLPAHRHAALLLRNQRRATGSPPAGAGHTLTDLHHLGARREARPGRDGRAA